VGYDGSKQSEHAVSVAFNLSHCSDAKVLIFAVARPPEPATRVELEGMLDDTIETEEKLRKVMPLLDEMVQQGLVVLSDVNIIKYTHDYVGEERLKEQRV
jgi:hypothetical protein